MKDNISGLKKIPIPMTGGTNEVSAVHKVPLTHAIEMENFRLTKDGTRYKKRLGSEEVVAAATFGSKDPYGFTTYYDEDGNFCQLAVTEVAIWRKIGAGAWTSIHTLTGDTLAHPVRVLEIQGKQYIITENDSRFIHTDGNDYQIGIAAPTTLATVELDYDTACENEDCAAIADWDKTVGGAGDCTQVTFDTQSCFKFEGAGNLADYAYITKTAGTAPGKRFQVEVKMYMDTFQHASKEKFVYFIYYTATDYFTFSTDGYQLTVNSIIPGRVGSVGIELAENTWYVFKFNVDTEDKVADVYVDDVYYGTQIINTTGTEAAGYQYIYCSGHYVASAVYVDYIKVYNSSDSSTAGTRRKYAVKYARSGNYGNEGNPIMSLVNSVVHYGAGLNDLTSGGTFTGDTGVTIQVQIDGTGATDTFKISYDGGANWHMTEVPMTATFTLFYGITLTWAATTGHTLNDYWNFTCQNMSVRRSPEEQVNITSIPTSSDAQVDQRKLYRTVADGDAFFWLTDLNDNTATAFNDNSLDKFLGATLTEDHDVLTNSKLSEYWDDCLWIAVDHTVYRSKQKYPESFDISKYYITLRYGRSGSEITQMRAYNDALYVTTRNSIFKIFKSPSGGYGRRLVTGEVGCVAPWSMVEANDLLMFLSHRGLEIFNGIKPYPAEFSFPVKRTMDAIDTSKYDFFCATHLMSEGEIVLSLPYNADGSTTKAVAYNYLRNEFYIFRYHKVISCVDEARNSSKKLVNYICFANGDVCLMESTYKDQTTVITAKVRKPWIDTEKYADINSMEVEYELPVNKTLTANIYVNFDKDVQRTTSLTGVTPAATNLELRRPICDPVELGQRGKYVCLELTNAEDLGGDLKINEANLWVKPRARKGKISAD